MRIICSQNIHRSVGVHRPFVCLCLAAARIYTSFIILSVTIICNTPLSYIWHEVMIPRYAPLRHQFAPRACLFLLLISINMSELDAAPTDTTTVKETWIRDVTNINPITDLQSANLADESVAKVLWLSLRRLLIRRLMTLHLWDWLVDFAIKDPFTDANRVELKVYENLGIKQGHTRNANLRREDVRLRAQNVIEAFLPPCEWLDDFIRLSDDKLILSWFHDLDEQLLKIS